MFVIDQWRLRQRHCVGRAGLIRPAGMIQIRLSRSNSCHVAFATSDLRWPVNNMKRSNGCIG